jgi:hypothetical protein
LATDLSSLLATGLSRVRSTARRYRNGALRATLYRDNVGVSFRFATASLVP